MHMRTLALRGNPYEQGVTQGRASRDAIITNLRQIQRLVREIDRGLPDWYTGLVATCATYTRGVDPDTLDELAGIAAGSGVDVGDIWLMNFPVYMLLRRARVIDECSVFAVCASSTSESRTYVVKTRDQDVTQFQFEHVLLKRSYPDGSSIVEINAAGIVTNPGSGINDRGLAMGTAGSWSRAKMEVKISSLDSARPMPDMHEVLRRAGSVTEALEVLAATPRLAGMNLILADRHGVTATVELTAQQAVVTHAVNGYCAITNHYLHRDLSHLNDSFSDNPSSYRRLARMNEYLAERVPTVSFRDVLRLVMDQKDGPQDSICRSTDGLTGSVTRYTSVSILEDYETWAIDGLPTSMASVA